MQKNYFFIIFTLLLSSASLHSSEPTYQPNDECPHCNQQQDTYPEEETQQYKRDAEKKRESEKQYHSDKENLDEYNKHHDMTEQESKELNEIQ